MPDPFFRGRVKKKISENCQEDKTAFWKDTTETHDAKNPKNKQGKGFLSNKEHLENYYERSSKEGTQPRMRHTHVAYWHSGGCRSPLFIDFFSHVKLGKTSPQCRYVYLR